MISSVISLVFVFISLSYYFHFYSVTQYLIIHQSLPGLVQKCCKKSLYANSLKHCSWLLFLRNTTYLLTQAFQWFPTTISETAIRHSLVFKFSTVWPQPTYWTHYSTNKQHSIATYSHTSLFHGFAETV